MLALAPGAALVFLIATAPLAFIAAFNDLKHMKLPNVVVGALALTYVVVAPFVLPFEQYLWGFAHGAAIYVVGMFLFFFAGVGAGDGKFAAAMAMFIPVADAAPVLMLFSAFLLGAFAAHGSCAPSPLCAAPRRTGNRGPTRNSPWGSRSREPCRATSHWPRFSASGHRPEVGANSPTRPHAQSDRR